MEADHRITELLNSWTEGDKAAEEELLLRIHGELHLMAERFMRRERDSHTLEPAAVINEVYLRLVGQEARWKNRTHFYAVAAKTMRRILLDHARGKNRLKRGGGAMNLSFDEALEIPNQADFTHLHEALCRLETADPRAASVVELRFFGGMSLEEIAQYFGCSRRTIDRTWKYARAFLVRSLA